jgi:uncharacterized protein YoxC
VKGSELNIETVQKKCYKLEYVDDETMKKLDLSVSKINSTFEEHAKEMKQTKTDHERKFG